MIGKGMVGIILLCENGHFGVVESLKSAVSFRGTCQDTQGGHHTGDNRGITMYSMITRKGQVQE